MKIKAFTPVELDIPGEFLQTKDYDLLWVKNPNGFATRVTADRKTIKTDDYVFPSEFESARPISASDFRFGFCQALEHFAVAEMPDVATATLMYYTDEQADEQAAESEKMEGRNDA